MNREIKKLAQKELKDQGFYHGKIDGLWGKMSNAALEAKLKADQPKPASSDIRPPASDYKSVCQVFGKPGDESKLVVVESPYPIYYQGTKTRLRCHKLIAKPLVAALKETLDTYGLEWIKKHKLDQYDGCYNFRKSRNSNATSKHCWGIAIDLNADENRNKQPWVNGKQGQKIPGTSRRYASMPKEFIDIMKKHGFKSGGEAWGRDAMHFQFTK